MRMQTDKTGFLTLISLVCLLNLGPLATPHVLTATPLPTLISSSSNISIAGSLIVSQFDLSRSSSTTSYPQDQEQEFQLGITLLQLMEITATNQTASSQVLDTLNLQTLNWKFTHLRNASEIQYGQNLHGQLYANAHFQRGSRVYDVNVSLDLFASARQNETQIISSDWLAIVPVGGPSQIGLEMSISGWAFRTPQDLLALRILIDGSQGTVRHHTAYSSTGLFNTIGVVNDVTQRRDASLNWLHRAIEDNGTVKTSAEVGLNTFSNGDALYADVYYQSFANSTLTHEFILETSNSFQAATFVPIHVFILLAGASTLLVLTLSIAYLSRRSYFVLHRQR